MTQTLTATGQRVSVMLGVLLALLTVGSLLGRWHWALDVLSHFTIAYAWGLAGCLLLGALLRVNWRYLLVIAAGLVPNLLILLPYYLPPSVSAAPTDDTQVLSLLTINLGTTGDNYQQVTDYVQAADADLLLFTEVRQDFLEHMGATLAADYPHVFAEPSRYTLGLAWVSKTPFQQTEVVRISEWRRFLSVTLDVQGQPVTLFSVHPLPPLNGRWAQSRNDEFEVFAAEANAVDTPLILLGDFNAAPWAYPVRRLNAAANLRPGGHGHGVRPTWFYAGVVQAPLDYMLVSPEWDVLDYASVGNVGSDHAPVVAQVALRPD